MWRKNFSYFFAFGLGSLQTFSHMNILYYPACTETQSHTIYNHHSLGGFSGFASWGKKLNGITVSKLLKNVALLPNISSWENNLTVIVAIYWTEMVSAVHSMGPRRLRWHYHHPGTSGLGVDARCHSCINVRNKSCLSTHFNSTQFNSVWFSHIFNLTPLTASWAWGWFQNDAILLLK